MRCRPSWSLSTLGSKHACDKNLRSSVTYSSISVFPPHPIPSSRTTKYAAYETRNTFLLNISWIVRDCPRSSDCAPDDFFQGSFLTPPIPKILGKISSLETAYFLERFGQVHNLTISDRLLRSKKCLVGKYSWFYMQRIS